MNLVKNLVFYTCVPVYCGNVNVYLYINMNTMLIKIAVVLLGLPALALASISQRELRGVFLHHQEYCRERAERVGAGGGARRHWVAHQTRAECERDGEGPHEWFVDSSSIDSEDAFLARTQDTVSGAVMTP